MLNEEIFGSRDKRGDWRPNTPLSLPPLTSGQHRTSWGHWAVGFVWPWNLLFMLISLFAWNIVLPELNTMSRLGLDWTSTLLLFNWLSLFIWLGTFELVLYRQRRQQHRFKYNKHFPEEKPAPYFWFEQQNIDNFLRTMLISVPIMTAIEILVLWAFANGVGTVSDHVGYLALICLLISPFHEGYYFFLHRAMHWPPFYKWCHKIHHNSINPSPWTSLSNHPIESALQFAPALGYLLIPAHPLLAIYHLHVVAYSSVIGHIGFDKIELGDEHSIDSHAYAHYLHHKYFEVNYCDNGYLPWDKWFGSWHDGSQEGDKLMKARMRERKGAI